MAYFTIPGINIKGLAAAVPKNCISNNELSHLEESARHKLIDTIGIEKRRVSAPNQCASDLCVAAANKLIEDLAWNKSEIEVLFFVSQTPDYQLPGTSLHIQERLGLPKTCVCFDINQGCAGYVYGLSLISAFMASSEIKKGLLLVGDTITKLISKKDTSLLPLFSDCGTATALMREQNAQKMHFNISSEGADYGAIIVPEGGARKPVDQSSINYVNFENDISRRGVHLVMKGLEVFNFSLKKVSPNIEELLFKANCEAKEIDYFILHQANKLILESIGKKLKVDSNKVPSSLKQFGNTSGATIPLTILTNLKKGNKMADAKLVLSGFGVGLSLASAIVDFNAVICSDLIELA